MLLRLIALSLLLVGAALPARAEPVRTEHLEVELTPQTAWVAPGATVHVALRQQIADGWHTYWTNPGDTGQATSLVWRTSPGVTVGEPLWPTPERIITRAGETVFMNYGYTGRVLTPIPVSAPADARPGDVLTLDLSATFYVCSDTLCVPEDARVRLELPVREGAPPLHGRWGAAVNGALASVPRPEGLTARASLTGGVLSLAVVGPAVTGIDADGAYFLPDSGQVLRHAAVQRVQRGRRGLTLSVPAADSLIEAGLEEPITGVLATRAGAWRIRAVPGPAPDGARGLGEAEPAAAAGALGPARDMGWLKALGFAFLGGLILNLMPCVFPILSMKAASLTGAAGRPEGARREGLAFLGGVLVSFLALAGALLALRAGGEAVGWGFQLQSPLATGALSLVMLAVALNLSSLYHAGASAQRAGLRLAGPLARFGGATGAFLTGVLAVVVAAPCTAPFMAAAIGFAMTLPAAAALSVFLALGLGFALPFVALSLSPALLRRLPRPGAWMVRVKALMAIPMYGAAAWLAWVFLQQTGPAALGWLLGAAAALAAALVLFGRRQRALFEGWRRPPSRIVMTLAFVLAGGLLVGALGAPRVPAPQAAARALPSEPWSPERLARLRAEGRPVLVNFTADWCVTCKVNEATALSSERVARALAREGAVYLVADWTRRDAAIAAALAEHGRSGVPLYLVYAGEAPPAVLPQLLTEGAVIAAVREARLALSAAPRPAPSPESPASPVPSPAAAGR